MLDAMTRVREQDGVPFAVQVRRALRAWLDARKVEQVLAVIDEPSELAETWVKATLDDDEDAFVGMSPTRIRAEYRKWLRSIPKGDAR